MCPGRIERGKSNGKSETRLCVNDDGKLHAPSRHDSSSFRAIYETRIASPKIIGYIHRREQEHNTKNNHTADDEQSPSILGRRRQQRMLRDNGNPTTNNTPPEYRKRHTSRRRLCMCICGHISLVSMMCCLGFCVVPGVLALVALSAKNNEWALVDAVLVDKELCDIYPTVSPTQAPSGTLSNSYYPSFAPSREPSRSKDVDTEHQGRGLRDPERNGPVYKKWYLTYNYVTLEGQNLTSTGDYCTTRIGHMVFYDPDDPESFMDVDSLTHSLGFTKFMTSIGFAFVVVFFALMLWGYTRRKETASATFVENHVLQTVTTKNTTQVARAVEIPLAVPADSKPHPVAAAYPVAAATPIAFPMESTAPVAAATAFKGSKSKMNGPITVYK